MQKIIFQEKEGSKARCLTCNRKCLFDSESFHGFCNTRQYSKKENSLYSLVYGRSVSFSVDPIEKKPFYLFKQGTNCLSISTLGCSFACKFCQNYELSTGKASEQDIPFTSPEEVIEIALKKKVEGIAYTYNEPTVFLEYALDVMRLAREEGLYNVWVSNGYMTKQVLELIAPLLDAINIDLKGNEEFYRNVVGGAEIERVKENISFVYNKMPGTHLELTYLVIPGYNDSEETLGKEIGFIASLGKNIPVHFTRFYPQHRMLEVEPTPIESLKRAERIAKEKGLEKVFLGNIPF